MAESASSSQKSNKTDQRYAGLEKIPIKFGSEESQSRRYKDPENLAVKLNKDPERDVREFAKRHKLKHKFRKSQSSQGNSVHLFMGKFGVNENPINKKFMGKQDIEVYKKSAAFYVHHKHNYKYFGDV